MAPSYHRLIALGIASVAALSASSLTSCRSNTEVEYDTIVVHDTILIDTCHTPVEGELLVNGGFDINSTYTHNLGFNEMTGWEPYKGTPQTVPLINGKPGVIQIWGNGDPALGEGIAQRLANALRAGTSYDLSATFLFWNDNPANYTPYTRLRFIAFDDRGNEETIGTLQTSSETWITLSISNWTPSRSYTHVAVVAENDNVGTNSASWARLDNISLKLH
jgi:hypothetical protein